MFDSDEVRLLMSKSVSLSLAMSSSQLVIFRSQAAMIISFSPIFSNVFRFSNVEELCATRYFEIFIYVSSSLSLADSTVLTTSVLTFLYLSSRSHLIDR